MDTNSEKLKSYLSEKNIPHEIQEFQMSVHTVEMAAGAVGVSLDQMIKTVVMIDSKNDTVVTIIRGDDRMSISRVGFQMKLDGLRMASADEVLQRTGYPIGGVPPLGFSAKFAIDVKVKDMMHCWAGGGSDRALMKLNPADIIKDTNAFVGKITV